MQIQYVRAAVCAAACGTQRNIENKQDYNSWDLAWDLDLKQSGKGGSRSTASSVSIGSDLKIYESHNKTQREA